MTLKRWFQSALALAVVATGAAVVQTPAHAAGQVYGPYLLVNASTFFTSSPQCLDNPNFNKNNNTIMEIYKCVGSSNQQWSNETAVTNSDYWTFNGASGKCLAVQNASTTQGAKVLQYTCTSGTNERWTYPVISRDRVWSMTLGDKTYTSQLLLEIKNVKSKQCLSTSNGALTSGSQTVQVGCSNATPDLWIQFPV